VAPNARAARAGTHAEVEPPPAPTPRLGAVGPTGILSSSDSESVSGGGGTDSEVGDGDEDDGEPPACKCTLPALSLVARLRAAEAAAVPLPLTARSLPCPATGDEAPSLSVSIDGGPCGGSAPPTIDLDLSAVGDGPPEEDLLPSSPSPRPALSLDGDSTARGSSPSCVGGLGEGEGFHSEPWPGEADALESGGQDAPSASPEAEAEPPDEGPQERGDMAHQMPGQEPDPSTAPPRAAVLQPSPQCPAGEPRPAATGVGSAVAVAVGAAGAEEKAEVAVPVPAPMGPRAVDYSTIFPSFSCLVSRFWDRPLGQLWKRRGDAAWDSQIEIEKALWYQWKLYGLWRQVMQDYSTVFSRPDEPVAEGSIGSSLVYTGTPSALHYRVVSSSRPEASAPYNIYSLIRLCY
jgi:hypothetical protein